MEFTRNWMNFPRTYYALYHGITFLHYSLWPYFLPLLAILIYSISDTLVSLFFEYIMLSPTREWLHLMSSSSIGPIFPYPNGNRWYHPHVFTWLYPCHWALASYLKLPHTHNITTTISVITFPVTLFKNKAYYYLCPSIPLLLENRTQVAAIIFYFFYT